MADSDILKENSGYTFKPSWNAAPTQSMPIITGDSGTHVAELMQWGISRKLGPDHIFNTRSEKRSIASGSEQSKITAASYLLMAFMNGKKLKMVNNHIGSLRPDQVSYILQVYSIQIEKVSGTIP